MVKVKAILNTKEKKYEMIECATFGEFKEQVEKAFNIDSKSIKIMKPPTRDQAAFLNNLKEGLQILFIGKQKKEMTEADLKKAAEIKKKEEEKIKQIQKSIEELKLDDHKKIIRDLQEKQITQRGFSYMNEQGKIQNLGTDHYTSVVHLLRLSPEFRKFCFDYKVQPKNPDGLIIEQLATNFKWIDGKKDGKADLVNPLEWCSAFIAYCADDIEYPYPTYDYNYIIPKIFDTIYNAYVTQSERKQPNATPTSIGAGCSLFGISLNLEKTKITPLDQDDYEVGELVHKTEYKYILECDLSDPSIKTFEDGIKKRFQEKNIWENFYAFDLEYKEKIKDIEKPPKYIFVHINRVGYPPAKDESEEIVLYPTAKSTHQVRTRMILDLSQMCSQSQKDKFENGKFERYQLFYPYGEDQEFKKYQEKFEKQFQQKGYFGKEFDIMEIKYMFFDQKLYDNQIFDEYYFQQPLKGSKQTGEYRIIGCIYHKGKYYHHPDPKHTKDSEFQHDMNQCRGEFMVMIYKQGKQWLKFQGGKITITDIDEAIGPDYWGGTEYTPVLALYREIYIKNIQIEQDD